MKQETTPKTRHAIVDGKEDPDITIVPSNKDVKVKYDPPTTEEENPYANISTTTRDLSSFDDISSDYKQLQELITVKENIAKALSIMLNLVENNPLIVNKLIIAPPDVLAELIRLLTSADEVKFSYLLDSDVGCSCGAVKFIPIDKIYVVKGGETKILKYSYPDAIQLLDEHKISYKLVVNDN